MVLTPDDDRASRIPSAAWRALRQALTAGPVLVQVARPGEAALKALATGDAPPPIDAGRTAHELGRAFPGVPVLIADGEHVHDEIDRSPRIVVSTRGAEPRAPGGYRAVLLLDGRRMLARESLWVAEDCLRWWAAAAALAAPNAPVHLVGVSRRRRDRARDLAVPPSSPPASSPTGATLRFPPVVRLVTVDRPGGAVQGLVEELEAAGAEVLLHGADATGRRAVLRFDYGAGPRLAAIAKAALREGTARPAARSRPPRRLPRSGCASTPTSPSDPSDPSPVESASTAPGCTSAGSSLQQDERRLSSCEAISSCEVLRVAIPRRLG